MLPTSRTTSSEDLAAQRAYAKKMAGTRPSLVVADAFVRGIRYLGYKSTATALDELIDNSIQAGAENVHVTFGYSGKSDAKPDQIVVVDDGHGMPSAMLPFAISWGGTHREAPDAKHRHGMGRFGFGLPSASVSQCRCLTVLSKTAESDWNKVTLDLDEITNSKHLGPDGQILVPDPTSQEPPEWVSEYIKNQFDSPAKGGQGLTHGTIILLAELDNLSWTTTSGLERKLLEHFGIVYRNFLRQVKISVNGKSVEPVDPLFLTPGCRFYDIDEDRATSLDPITITVKDKSTKDDLGEINVRIARFPWTFGRQTKTALGEGKINERSHVMAEHNGFIFVREGRQIDVVTKSPIASFQNNDRFWKVEVNFPASLDEEFSVTTSKQQIVPSERIWTLLEQAGLKRAIKNMKDELERERAKFETKTEISTDKRPSEAIMEGNGNRKPRSLRREEEGNRNLDQAAQKQSRDTQRPFAEVRRELEGQIKGNPYKVHEERQPGGPFFRVEQIGGQVALFLNVAHRFYTDIYAGPESTPRLRAALELLLFTIGECKLDTTSERQDMYDEEIQAWSTMLNSKLGTLSRDFNTEDVRAEKDAQQEVLDPFASVANKE